MIIFAIITNINQKTNIMKRFFAILSVVMLAGLLACAAPKKKSRVKKAVNKTAKKAASKSWNSGWSIKRLPIAIAAAAP